MNAADMLTVEAVESYLAKTGQEHAFSRLYTFNTFIPIFYILCTSLDINRVLGKKTNFVI